MPIKDSLPVAEIFDSIQGEGTWVGTPMRFVRLAGCPVGQKATQELVTQPGDPLTIPSFESNPNLRASYCKTWDGRAFVCDTDFSCHTYMSVSEILDGMKQRHICLTGGEPLIHQKRLVELGFFQKAFQHHHMIHIETSGTILLLSSLTHDSRIWITVAPKWQCLNAMLQLANEVKYLVDENFDPSQVNTGFVDQQIFVSPINNEKTVNQDNVQRALAVLEKYPTWRLSCQWHKFLNLR
jgi:7-carboxy-7-deazaguanine synthase